MCETSEIWSFGQSEIWPLVEGEIWPLDDEIWEVFTLDEETAEPEPTPDDFWGAMDSEEED